jgi:isoaspartyl peptidase/L-asparaginase-like protein (Ntn-hydrolase superfamily)
MDAKPLILSTWSFGQPANAAAWNALAAGGKSLDAVETAARYAEADVTNHTVGLGGLPDRSGRVSLDAAIMASPSRRGAVAFVRNYVHAVSIARRVMEKTPHVLLVGEGAEEFAAAEGFQRAELLTESSRSAWNTWRQSNQSSASAVNVEEQRNTHHDTIGVLALDARGSLSGACTTSGRPWKLPGRVGDSPIIGHGLYVDPKHGAAVCTGLGELVMGICGSFLAVELMRGGSSPADAARGVMNRLREAHPLGESDQVGIITLDPAGRWSSASLRDGFRVAVRSADLDQLLDPEFVALK